MQISGRGTETFLFLNGIGVTRVLRLGDSVELQPASCSPTPDFIIKVSRTELDLGVITIFLRKVGSQIRVVADTPKELAISAWNSVWDAVLLSAFCHCEAVCNLQSDTSAENLGNDTHIEVTNYYLRGLSRDVHIITEEEAIWLEQNFETARILLEKSSFQNAVHSLASYKWHTLPRARLAILWSGMKVYLKLIAK